jgi:hypothetical protein
MDKVIRGRLWMIGFVFVLFGLSAMADTRFHPRMERAAGYSPGRGECVIRLVVDGEVQVNVRGDDVYVRTISGREARDNGSVCTAPMPRNGGAISFEKREGRGEVQLLSQPSDRDDAVVVRINDPKAGDAPYSFRIAWQENGGYRPGGGWTGGIGSGYRPVPAEVEDHAIDACQDAASAKIADQYRYRNLRFRDTRLGDRSGDDGVVSGEATGTRGLSSAAFRFSCRVDLDDGDVRSVDVTRR